MVVRMRHTSSHTKNRRSHHALKGERMTKEKDSGTVHPRHRALLDGTPYRGRSVMDVTTKKASDKKAATDESKQKEEKKKVMNEQVSKETQTSKRPTEKKIKK